MVPSTWRRGGPIKLAGDKCIISTHIGLIDIGILLPKWSDPLLWIVSRIADLVRVGLASHECTNLLAGQGLEVVVRVIVRVLWAVRTLRSA